jgi:xylan 1,4-beta-xylosidase
MQGIGYVDFKCDVTDASLPFPHFWEHTVGSCHATMALRADWQSQLRRCHQELGFQHVRFHGILSDDMGTLMCENEQLVYSFFNADQIIDFLLSIGMRPFIELSFMPTTLSSGNDIVFHYKGNVNPPKDYDGWKVLISKLVTHWVQRYGASEVAEWFFEVWNEPNLDAFWKGSQADYFKLYKYTAEAIREVNPALKVGGPATANNEWIAEFLAFCNKDNVPVDFISTHHYPTDSFGKPGDNTEEQLAASVRSALRKEAAEVRSKAKGLPVYYTEWCTSSNPFDSMHDEPYAAAFIIKTVMEATGLVNGYSYWTFSDIFEENYFSSAPFHGGFGLMNIYGVPKPAYRAFELLHRLGNDLLPVEGGHETVDAWVIRGKGKVTVLLTNWALPRHDIKMEMVRITLTGLPEIREAHVERIDETHANAAKGWADMGMPESLSPHMVQALESKSRLNKEAITVFSENNTATMEIVLQAQAIACITLEINE